MFNFGNAFAGSQIGSLFTGDPISGTLGGYLGGGSFNDVNDYLSGKTQFNREATFSREMWDRNAKLQRQFAQMGIRWKVADAKKAGLHPLAALGASTHSGTPISVGTPSGGQGISPGSIMSMVMSMAAQRGLQNAQSRYYNALADQVIAGQGDSAPGATPGNAVYGSASGDYGKKTGEQTDYGLAERPGGGLTIAQSQNSQGMDEDPGAAIRRAKQWHYVKTHSPQYVDMKNRKGMAWDKYKQNIMSFHPRKHPGPGKTWQWSIQSQYWKAVPQGSPKFESTYGMAAPKNIGQQFVEVLSDAVKDLEKQYTQKMGHVIDKKHIKPAPTKQRAYPVQSLGRGRGHYPKRRSMFQKRP